jgi:RPA family protein
MAIIRQTAKIIRISDINTGTWVKKEGMEPSYVETRSGEQVARARILGTVVNVFTSEDGNFGSATIDDSTDTIRLKVFKTLKPIDGLKVGDLVDIIGRVREYNEELYIMPEVVRKIDDPNIELLRRLQLLKKQSAAGKEGPKEEEADANVLRKKILEVIESGKEGVDFSTIMGKVKASEEEIESVVNDLLSEGICYEPTPGKIRKI